MHCLRRLHYIKFDCLRLWPWRMFALSEHSLVTSDKGGGKCFCPCSFVCLSVSKISQKRAHGFGWKCCVSTYVGTWTNWLTFEPDPDYSPDAGTGLLSPISYKRCNAEFYIGKIPRTRIGGVVSGARHVFKMVLFAELSDNRCRRCMRSTECPSSYIYICV